MNGVAMIDAWTLAYAFAAVLVGFQFLAFAVFTKVFAISESLLPEDPRVTRMFRYITLEIGLAAGAILAAAGIGGTIFAVVKVGLGTESLDQMLPVALSSAFSLALGVEVICSSFFSEHSRATASPRAGADAVPGRGIARARHFQKRICSRTMQASFGIYRDHCRRGGSE
jgi:hypothetical protein